MGRGGVALFLELLRERPPYQRCFQRGNGVFDTEDTTDDATGQ